MTTENARWTTGPTNPTASKPLTLADRDALILEWREAKDKLEMVKAIEADLRTQLVDAIFDPKVEKGTENFELGNGWKLKAVKKLNYNLSTDAAAVEKALEQLPEWLRPRICKRKYDLSVKEYELLDDDNQEQRVWRRLINEVLTIKPGMPSLELVPPKGKGNGNGNCD